jgi:hypothetical protein
MYQFDHKDSLTQGEIFDLYDLIKKDAILWKTLWYDGPPDTPHLFLGRIKEWWFVRVRTADNHTVGTFWLNGYMGRTAQIHFAIFEEHRANAVEIGKATLQWLESLGWLHSVYGLTPVTHRHVFPFIGAIGFQILGKIPGSCWIERKEKFIAGVVSVYDFGRKP